MIHIYTSILLVQKNVFRSNRKVPGMKWRLYIAILLVSLWGCRSTKLLKEDELLLVENSVEFEQNKPNKSLEALSPQLIQLADPKPSSGLDLVKNGIYNLMGTPKKESSLTGWIKNKLGAPPTLLDLSIARRSGLRMEKFLADQGYFQVAVGIDTSVTEKKAKVIYEIDAGPRYFIQHISYPPETTALGKLIGQHPSDEYLETKIPYQLSKLTQERNRISNLVKDSGYFNFNTSRLFYYVDTTYTDTTYTSQSVGIHLRLKPETDSTHSYPYRLGDLYVYPDYELDKISTSNNDTITTEQFSVIQGQEFVKPSLLDKTLTQSKGELYNKTLQDRNLKRLVNLGIFQFVNLKYQEDTVSTTPTLDRYLYLTPALTQDIAVELQLNNRNGDFLGTNTTLTYRHNNLFRGAERLEIQFSGGVETQLGNVADFINTLNLQTRINLSFPKLLVPFSTPQLGKKDYFPRTSLQLTFDFQRRTNNYTINSWDFRYSYNWRVGNRFQHTLSPVTISQVRVINTTASFDSLLQTNRRLEASFENFFILGAAYTMNHTTQGATEGEDYTFFRMDVETSGNLAQLYTDVIANESENPATLFNTPFSQYFRWLGDIRRYWFNANSSWVFRSVLGLGIPYGNSDVMPYNKQFFVGGANSIRAFRIRALGPGAYESPLEATDQGVFFDQVGDIRLETNLEYRFDLISYLKGAAFLDAGNIWLIRAEEEFPGGEFTFDNFYRQIGIGTGIGLRLDIDYFVLRLDVAFPLRDPSLPVGDRWLVDKIRPWDSDWRQDQLVWHIAIGYPF